MNTHLAQVTVVGVKVLEVCGEMGHSDAERFIFAPAVSYSLPPFGLLIWKPEAGGLSTFGHFTLCGGENPVLY